MIQIEAAMNQRYFFGSIYLKPSRYAFNCPVLFMQMKKLESLTLLALGAVLFLAISGTADANTVTVSTSMNWSALTSGSGAGGQPNASDSVIVNNNATLTVDAASETCGDLQLGGSTGGSGNGALFFNSGASLIVDNGSTQSGVLAVGISGGGTGSINMSSGGALYTDTVTVGNAGTWTPAPTPTGALVQIGACTLSATTLSFFSHFNNLAIAGYDKTDPIDSTALAGPLVVSGNLEVLSLCQLNDAGSYAISVGGNLLFDGPGSKPNFNPGTGTVTLNGNSAQTVNNPDPDSEFYNLTINNSSGGVSWSGATAINNMLTLTSGTLSGAFSVGLANGATISRAAGSLSGAPQFGTSLNLIYTGSTAVTNGSEIPTATTVLSNLTINNTAGVTLVSTPTVNGPLNIMANAVLNISGGGLALDNSMTNSGMVNWLAGPVFLNSCSYANAGPVVNRTGAQWNIQCDQTMSFNCGTANTYFTNAGMVLKSADVGMSTAGTTFLTIPFYNTGTVQANDGILGLADGGSLGGAFVAASGAAVDFDGGTFPLVNTSPTSSGAGQVQFTSGSTVTFSQPITSFSMAGGTLSGNNVVTGVLNWTGGNVVGPLTITNNATLNISGIGLALDSVLTNAGTVNWLGGAVFLDTCGSTNAGPLVNLAGGQWNIECDQTMSYNCVAADAYFQNAGMVLKTNATGLTTILIPFYNSGTLQADSGTISLTNGGTLGGAFVAKANAAVDFSGGTFPLAGAAPTGSGAGQVQFTGTADISFSAPMTGVLNCAGGIMTGPLTISSSGTLNISGIGLALDSTLTNSGTVNWLGGLVYLNTCSPDNGGPVVNLAGGQWNIECDQNMLSCQPAASAYFTNAGIVVKTNTTGTNTISIPFNNSGTVECEQGTIGLEDGGILGGTFMAAAGAAIDFDGGSFPLTSAAPASSGAGAVQFTGTSSISFSAPMTGVLNCAGGVIITPLTVSSTGTLNISGIGVTLNSALTNAGTVNWLGGNLYLAVCDAGPLINLPGAMWNIQSGETNSFNCSTTNTYFQNEGMVHKTVGMNTTYFSIYFNNSGTVEADTGAISLEQGGALGGSFVTESGAAIDFDSGSFPLAGAAPTTNGTGHVQFTGTSIITFSAPMSGVLNCAGGVISGPLTVMNSATLNIGGIGVTLDGTLTNAGTVNWLGGNVFLDTCADPSSGPLVNQASGQWNIQCDQSMLGSCLPANNAYFVNAGMVLKTNTTGTTTISIPFYNSGTLQADAGTIGLTNGGTLGGSFVAKAGAAIDFEGGSFPLVGAAPAGSGPGQVQFTDTSSVTFSAPMTGILNCAGGIIASPLTISSTGMLNISGIGVALEGPLTNSGTVNWLGGLVFLNSCSPADAGPLVNLAGGQWNIQCDQNMTLSCPSGNAYFTNAGSVLKTNTTGVTTLSIPFDNSGTLQADTGTIALTNGGILGGMFVAEAGAAIDFEGGSFPLVSAAPASSGAGQVQFTGTSAITCSQPMTGVLNCAGGTIAGPFTISASGTLNVSGIGVALDSTLTNAGIVNWLGGAVFLSTCSPNNAGPVVNLATGQWNIQCDQTMSDSCSSANAYFTNAGTVLKTNTSGMTTISIPFANSATVQADTGTILYNSAYADASSANLSISLGGATPDTGYGQIQFAEAPAFAGTLSASTRNGFQPTMGEVFTVLNYPSYSGVFSSTNLTLSGGIVLQPQFSGTSLTLTAANGSSSQPQLSVSTSGNNIIIQWPSGFSSWTLQSTTNLVSPSWMTVSGTSGNQAIVPIMGAQQFFRLKNGP